MADVFIDQQIKLDVGIVSALGYTNGLNVNFFILISINKVPKISMSRVLNLSSSIK